MRRGGGAGHACERSRRAERRLDVRQYLRPGAVTPVDRDGVRVQRAGVGEHDAADRDRLALERVAIGAGLDGRRGVRYFDRDAVLARAAVIVAHADDDVVKAVVGVNVVGEHLEAAAFAGDDAAGAGGRVAPEDGGNV